MGSWQIPNQHESDTWVSLKMRLVHCILQCEQNDPCSGCYQFDIRAPSVCVFQRFNGCNGGAAYFSLKWALEPTVRWRMVPWNIAGLMYAVSPYSPHLHPPCLVWIDFTKHEGWELMNFVVVHLPELAKMRFILPGRSMSVTGSESP